MEHVNIKIYGKVQGVGFRDFSKEKADVLRICGFVKNMGDGTLYIEAEGSAKNLKKFLAECHLGPALSNVEKVVFSFRDKIKNFEEFRIEY